MRSTTQEQIGERILPQAAENRAARPSATIEHDIPAPADSLRELDSIFCAHTVDLRRVSDAVRARPDLEALVLRLTASLALSPELPIATVEEAAVVLGRDRLRVLVHTWALLREVREKPRLIDHARLGSAQATGGKTGSAGSVPRWTPETLYLSTFLCWFGLQGRMFPDSYGNIRANFEHLNATAEELIRGRRPFSSSSISTIAEYVAGLLDRSISSGSAPLRKRLFELAAVAAGDREVDRERTCCSTLNNAGQLSGHLSGLAEILERDFLALVPYLETATAKPRQKAAVAGGHRSFWGKAG